MCEHMYSCTVVVRVNTISLSTSSYAIDVQYEYSRYRTSMRWHHAKAVASAYCLLYTRSSTIVYALQYYMIYDSTVQVLVQLYRTSTSTSTISTRYSRTAVPYRYVYSVSQCRS